MKRLLLLAMMTLLILPAFCQSTDTNPYVLGVTKQYKNRTQLLGFKPGRRLKIKTRQGVQLRSRNYTFSEQMIVMDAKDTILLEDIQWIRGNVNGNGGLKALGVVALVYSGMATIGIPVSALMTGDPWITATIAAGAAAYGVTGFKLLGARKFRSSNNWEVRAIEQEELLKLPRFQ